MTKPTTTTREAQPVSLAHFTIARGAIVAVEILTDPARLPATPTPSCSISSTSPHPPSPTRCLGATANRRQPKTLLSLLDAFARAGVPSFADELRRRTT